MNLLRFIQRHSLTVLSSSNGLHGQPIHRSTCTRDRPRATLSFYCSTAYKVLEMLISKITKIIIAEHRDSTGNKKKVMLWQTKNKNTQTWSQLRKRKFLRSFLSHSRKFPKLYLKYVDNFIPYAAQFVSLVSEVQISTLYNKTSWKEVVKWRKNWQIRRSFLSLSMVSKHITVSAYYIFIFFTFA